jgi:peptidoglycan/LPS O-acetylase OafA/YrhL
MVIKTIQLAMIMGDAGIIDLSLDVRKKVLFAVISLITSFTVATILVQGYHLGYAGLCLGFIVGQSVLSVAYPRIVAGILRIEHWKTIVEMLRSGAVSAILLMGAAWAGERVTAGNWIVFMLSAGMTFILFCACIYQFGLAKELRERLFVRLGLSLHV